MADYSSIFGPLSGAAGIGSGLYDLFSKGKTPAQAAMPYMQQIPQQTSQYHQPYFDAGTRAIPGLEHQYDALTNNPGQKLNEIGQSFHESPGFRFALQEALRAQNEQMNANGQWGPGHSQSAMELATNLGNQEYDRWLTHAQGLYGEGLHGQQGLSEMGQRAGGGLSDLISQALAAQGKLAYENQAQKQQRKSGAFGNILGGLAAFAAL